MGVVGKAGDDVPMQVRYDVAKAGKVDFAGAQDLAHGAFDLKYGVHQVLAFGFVEVGHFGVVGVPDDAAKGGNVCFVVDGDDA